MTKYIRFKLIHINIEFLQIFTTKENKFLVNKDQKFADPSEKMMWPSQYSQVPS